MAPSWERRFHLFSQILNVGKLRKASSSKVQQLALAKSKAFATAPARTREGGGRQLWKEAHTQLFLDI